MAVPAIVDPVLPGAPDEYATAQRGDQQPDDHGQRTQPRRGGRDAVDELHVGRQKRQGSQHREAHHERQHTAHRENRIREQPDRQNRFCGKAFDEDEGHQGSHRRDEQPDDRHRTPRVCGAAPACRQGQPGRPEPDQDDAGVIEHRSGGAGEFGNGDSGDRDDHHRHRHVDPEGPPPAQVVGEQPAEQRADDGGDAEDRPERTLVAATITQRNDLADHRDRGHRDGSAAKTLQCSGRYEHPHRSGRAAQHRPRQEEQDRHLEDLLATEGVAQFAYDGGDDGRGKQVTGDHPGLVPCSAQIGDDGGQRGRHDRLIEGGQQHAEHHCQENEVALPNGRPLTDSF